MKTAELRPVHVAELGKYRLIARLARGGMGDVYLAVSAGPGGFHKLVVVKELRAEFADDERYVAMFFEEARLSARLSHPNVVQVNEVGTEDGRHCMAMEYLDGRSLYRVHKQLSSSSSSSSGSGGRGRGLPLGAHLRVIAEALLGLHYAHELRGFDGEPLDIVHRDVSPMNVFVTFDGQAKVLDFGIAKAADSSLETQAGLLKGRLAYMAPEQATGARVDRRADVYAAGVMIWEAVAGRRLWPGMSDVEIFNRVVGEGPPALGSVASDAPPELTALCARAMARDPAHRHPSAGALLEDLDAHLSRRQDAVSMRQLGALVSEAFEAERRQMNATIEEALLAVRAGPQSGVMSTRTPGARDPHDEIASLASFLGATPSRAAADEERSRRRPASARPPLPTLAEGAASHRRDRVRQGAVAATMIIVAIVVAVIVSRVVGAGSPGPAAAPALPTAPALATAPAPAPAPTAATAPTTATSTPTPLATATAPTLTRAPSPRPARAPSAPTDSLPSPPPTPAPSARPDLDPSGGRAPLHPIITSNPYGAL